MIDWENNIILELNIWRNLIKLWEIKMQIKVKDFFWNAKIKIGNEDFHIFIIFLWPDKLLVKDNVLVHYNKDSMR